MKPTFTFLIVIMAIGLSSFRDPYWHAFFTVKNETKYELVIEINWKQDKEHSIVNVVIPSRSSRIIYDEFGFTVPEPEDVFAELRLKISHDGAAENFCTFNDESQAKWNTEYEMFDVYHSLSVSSSNDQYLHNRTSGLIAIPR